ncbi:MAG: ketopantoate reductase family protein [Deltaproteobacteria bacterium]
MRIVIVGPGAIGLLLYALLERTKQDVWLLDKDPARVKRLAKSGFRVEGDASLRCAEARITDDPSQLKDADLWFVCVKSYDTRAAVKRFAPHVRKEASVCSFQNGLGNLEVLEECFGAARVLAGVTQMGAARLSENVVRYSGEGETVFGRLDQTLSVGLKDLRELFVRARLPVRISRDVTAVLWSKLVLSAGINALSAVLRVPNGALIAHEGARRLMKEAVQEAYKVARRKRIKLLFDDPVAKAESICESTAENRSSMLVDILAQRPTEVDAINGAIVRYGESLNVKVPVNTMLLDMVRTITASAAQRVHA